MGCWMLSRTVKRTTEMGASVGFYMNYDCNYYSILSYSVTRNKRHNKCVCSTNVNRNVVSVSRPSWGEATSRLDLGILCNSSRGLDMFKHEVTITILIFFCYVTSYFYAVRLFVIEAFLGLVHHYNSASRTRNETWWSLVSVSLASLNVNIIIISTILVQCIQYVL